MSKVLEEALGGSDQNGDLPLPCPEVDGKKMSLPSVREALCHAQKADAFCRAAVTQGLF